ncbi:MAG: XTP/dITP diphosphatase [Candidatus Omnitrophica bacterium]|nr:XTP/dITP diphosphatase [Candidatus Omnitrophota bacterium]
MRITLLVATKNQKKLREIKQIMRDMPCKIISLADINKPIYIREDGQTFKENAIKKATTVAAKTGMLTMGEDSGLCVDALGGAPGVRSARYSGRNKSDEKNNQKLLQQLKDVPEKKRRAYYVCAIALADKNGLIGVVEGRCYGRIAKEPRGKNGFGYDPLFLIRRFGKTFGELPISVKHKISHRFKALKKVKQLLEKYIEKENKHCYN